MATRQLGQLAVIPLGQAFPHLAYVFLDDMVVVQQPLTGRTDVPPTGGRGGEPRVGIFQNPAGAVEACQQGSPPPAGAGGAGQALLRGQGLGSLTEMFGTEQLAADRAGEEVFPPVPATSDETGEEAGRTQGRDGGSLWMLPGGSRPGSSRAGGSSRSGSDGSAGCSKWGGALMSTV
ncbi:MAG: hypothetical protein ACJ8DJ_17375 [Gemmatimonadales bacterium]